MKHVLRCVGGWLNALFEETKHTERQRMITVLDGVRACAIIFVVVFHVNRTNGDNLWDWRAHPLASSLATAGGSGVTLFFVLSGFLLFLPYAKALLTAGRWPLARTFYLRRALRIIPGYYLSLFLLVLLTAPQYLQPAKLPELALFLTFFMDAWRPTFRALNGPYWTLAVEWQFYMLLPLIASGILLLIRRVRPERRLRAVTICLGGLIVGGLLVRLWGLYYWGNPTATLLVPRAVIDVLLFFVYGQTGKYIEDFAVGMLCALYYVYAQGLAPEHFFVDRLRRVSPWFWWSGSVVLLFSALWHFQSDARTPAWPFLNPIMPYFFWLNELLLAFGFALCIMALLFGPRILQRPFNWRPLRWIGLISYSLYIWHLPLIEFFQLHIQLPYLSALNHYLVYGLYWLWLLVVLVPFCVLYYAYVERPGIKLGERWRSRIEARLRAREDDRLSVPVKQEASV